jgi:hypothetical protein
MRKQFHTLRKFGHRTQSVVAVGCESANSRVAAVLVYGGLMTSRPASIARYAAAVLLILLAPVLTEGSNS